MTSHFILAHPIHPMQIFLIAVCETIVNTMFLDIFASIYIVVSIYSVFAKQTDESSITTTFSDNICYCPKLATRFGFSIQAEA
jgi:hypothetical protein